VNWRSISLLMKNQLTPESGFFAVASHTHGLLRVMEAVRAAEGTEPLGRLYAAYGEHLHHRKERDVSASTCLAEAGLSTSYADAATDEAFDAAIAASMADGLALTGKDVGTPILGFDNASGTPVGFFGPVISRRLSLADGLRLWDGVVAVAGLDSFWELKRTRTEGPDFTPLG
jgi:hypothetical protein